MSGLALGIHQDGQAQLPGRTNQASIFLWLNIMNLTTQIAYPERVLIYNAGTGKTVFIGCLKLTTILLFSFSCLIVAPSFYKAPDYPNWTAAAGQ